MATIDEKTLLAAIEKEQIDDSPPSYDEIIPSIDLLTSPPPPTPPHDLPPLLHSFKVASRSGGRASYGFQYPVHLSQHGINESEWNLFNHDIMTLAKLSTGDYTLATLTASVCPAWIWYYVWLEIAVIREAKKLGIKDQYGGADKTAKYGNPKYQHRKGCCRSSRSIDNGEGSSKDQDDAFNNLEGKMLSLTVNDMSNFQSIQKSWNEKYFNPRGMSVTLVRYKKIRGDCAQSKDDAFNALPTVDKTGYFRAKKSGSCCKAWTQLMLLVDPFDNSA